MMEQLRQWALNVSVTTVISGVLLSLVPSGKLKKCAEFFVCLLVLCCFFSPFLRGDGFNLSLEGIADSVTLPDTEELEGRLSHEVLSYTRSELENEFISCARQKGIGLSRVEIELSIDKGGNVSAESMRIYGAEAYLEDSLRELAAELFGKEVSVSFEE